MEENWDECSEITEEEGQRQSETLSQYYIEQECESKELFEKVERMDWVKEIRNIWLMDPLAPICFFTNVFILDDLLLCFDQHIMPLHVDTENFQKKSPSFFCYMITSITHLTFVLLCFCFLILHFAAIGIDLIQIQPRLFF